MKLFTSFYLYNKDKILKLATSNYSFKKLIDSNYIFLTGRQPLKKTDSLVEDFNVHIAMSSKMVYKDIAYVPSELKYSLVRRNGNSVLCCFSPTGSMSKINFEKRRAKLFIRQHDVMAQYFILGIINSIPTIMRTVRLHGVGIKNGKKLFLFVGRSNSGKTTIGNLLLQADKKNKLIGDDTLLVFPIGNRVYVQSFEDQTRNAVSYIFFIDRRRKSPSAVLPLSCKEAFKRIIFHSDVIFKKRDKEISDRLTTLEKLTFKYKSFLLVNGKDLKNNPRILMKLLHKAQRDVS